MSLLSHHSVLAGRSGKPSTSTVHEHRTNGDLRNVGGYLTPPFSPTSTSSDFIEGTNGGCGSGLGGADATAPQPRERTRDKLAKEVRKAKEKGKQKLLDSGGHNGYRRSAVVDAEGVEHDPEYRHFRTATPVVRRKSSSSSSDSSTSDGGSEDGLESQYSMNLAPSAHYSTSLLRQTAGGQPLTGQVPSYLPSAQHSLIKPHPNQVVPALLIPPSNMSTTRRRDKSGLNRDGTSSPRKSAEDFGARRSSADFARGEDRVDDLGYHLEKLKLPKDKKKRHLTGLAPSSASVAAAPPLRPSQSASQLAVPPVNPNRAVSPTAKTQKRQPSGGVTDGGVLDLRTATLRSNAQRYGSASSNNYGYGTSFAPSRTYASGLSGTAMAHSRPAGSTLLVPPRMERIASSSSSISESSALPSPLANPAPPPELSRITSQESGVSGQPQGGNPGPEGNRFVPPPGRVARKTREMQEDYAMGVHGMRRQYESFKLDVRFGMLRTKKKMERAMRNA